MTDRFVVWSFALWMGLLAGGLALLAGLSLSWARRNARVVASRTARQAAQAPRYFVIIAGQKVPFGPADPTPEELEFLKALADQPIDPRRTRIH